MIDQEQVRRALQGIESRDGDLARELGALRSAVVAIAGAETLAAALDGKEDAAGLGRAAYEYGRVARPIVPRPVTVVENGRPRGFKNEPEGKTWQERLDQAGGALPRAIDAVGRIEVKGNGDLTVAGTGFLIRSDVIATNRHVAEQFAEAGEGGFVFKLNLGDEEMEASIDFLEEVGRGDSLEFRIVRVLPMEPDVGTDVAFLEVAPTGSGGKTLPRPLEFSTDYVEPGDFVAAIGYPQRDTRVKHAAELEAIFSDVFDKKRVSPGEIRRIEPGAVFHDCSVLRGSSGSPLIHLKTGKVVGIHSVGEFLEVNVAVSARAAEAVLASVEAKRAAESRLHSGVDATAAEPPVEPPAASARPAAFSGELMVPSMHWGRTRPRTGPHAGGGPSQ
ncbi:MAG: trypsin-like serine peptidase [Longimicrobiaceae bacterium]